MLRRKKKMLLSYYRVSERKFSVCVSFIIWRAIHTNIFLMKIIIIVHHSEWVYAYWTSWFGMEPMELNINKMRVFGIRRRFCLWLVRYTYRNVRKRTKQNWYLNLNFIWENQTTTSNLLCICWSQFVFWRMELNALI